MTDIRPIPGFPDYFATDRGEIISTKRGKRLSLKISRSSDPPYGVVSIAGEDRKIRSRRVAQLICTAFHGPKPTPLHEVAHNNSDPSDDRPCNLRWATRKENAADRIGNGTHPAGENSPCAKLTAEQARYIRDEPRSYGCNVRLSKMFGVAIPTIVSIRQGINWRSLDDTAQHGVQFSE